MHPWLKLVAAGWLAHAAVESLCQDAIGKARWLAMVDAGWMSAWITVPVALALLVLSAFLIHENKWPIHLDAKFNVRNHIHIPSDMDKEDIAELVDSLNTEVEQA